MEVQTENKMGTMPINKLLVNISLPMVVSMLVQALYNIVDSVFVAQIDEYALTAVSLAFPLQNFMIAVAAGTGVGVNALLSKRLGEQRLDEANLAAGNSVFLAGCNYLLFLLIGIGFSDFYFRVQTDIPEIIAYGKIYMFICTACSFGLFGQFCFERLLQATGRTVCTMITQTTGAVLNLIFDPILIFGWFGFPQMGIAGLPQPCSDRLQRCFSGFIIIRKRIRRSGFLFLQSVRRKRRCSRSMRWRYRQS